MLFCSPTLVYCCCCCCWSLLLLLVVVVDRTDSCRSPREPRKPGRQVIRRCAWCPARQIRGKSVAARRNQRFICIDLSLLDRCGRRTWSFTGIPFFFMAFPSSLSLIPASCVTSTSACSVVFVVSKYTTMCRKMSGENGPFSRVSPGSDLATNYGPGLFSRAVIIALSQPLEE